MQFNDLVPDVYGEIFSYLKPYALSQMSLTSKHFRQNALTDTLWEKHLARDFPYCLEKGTSFEKYSKCKWKSLCHVKGYFERKCVLLIEAGHLNEIKVFLPKCFLPIEEFLTLEIAGKTLPRIINELEDQPLKEYLYSEVKKKSNSNFWDIVFGKGIELINPSRYVEYLHQAVRNGSLESIDYLIKLCLGLSMEGPIQETVCNGNSKIINCLYDQGIEFYEEDFKLAAQFGNQEVIKFFIEIWDLSPQMIKEAIELSVANGQPGTLELLLPLYSKDKADLNHLLDWLDFDRSPNETAACLKILLDKIPTLDHESLNNLLHHVCFYPNNEMPIEILLKKGANPNLSFLSNGSTPLSHAVEYYDLPIIKMLIDHGAVVTQEAITQAQLVNSSEIITLLESHAI